LKKTGLVVFLSTGCLGLCPKHQRTLNEDYYHWVTRYEIKAGRIAPELFTSVKPFKRKAIVAFMDSLDKMDSRIHLRG